MVESMGGEQPQFGILIHRPVQDVWDYVMTIERTPEWRPRMSHLEWLDGGDHQLGSRFRLQAKALRYTFKFDFEVSRWEPPYWFGYRQLNGPFAIDSHMQFVEESGGCRFNLGGNPQPNTLIAKLIEPLMWGTLAKQNRDDLLRLKQIMESGADGSLAEA